MLAADKETATGEETRIKEEARANEIVAKVDGKTGTVETVERGGLRARASAVRPHVTSA